MTGPPSEPPAAPYVPHDTRSEARRRIVVGLAGLVCMLLLVMLTGFLTEQARENPQEAEAIAPSPTEPLGDVSPESVPVVTAPTTEPVTPVVPEADGTITVPDLQPDPQLEAAKNRR